MAEESSASSYRPLSFVAEAITGRAMRFAAEGRHLAAALEYQALAELDRDDLHAALRWAYHALRGGQRERAAEGWLTAACTYARREDTRRAMMLLRRAFELAPGRCTRARMEAVVRAAGEPAASLAERAAVGHLQAGRFDAARDLHELLAECDPSSVTKTIKAAQLGLDHGDAERAEISLRAAAGRMHATGRAGEYVRVVEAMISAGTRCDGDALLELARIYLRRGETAQASVRLELLRRVEPHRLEAVELLLRAYAALGRTQDALRVLHDVAERREHDRAVLDAMFIRTAAHPSRDPYWSRAIRSYRDWLENPVTQEIEVPGPPPPPPMWGTLRERLPMPP